MSRRRKQLPRFGRGLSAASLVAMAATLASAADAPTGGEPGVRAFVLSNIYMASSGDAGACPVLADGGIEEYFKSLPPEEQAKYSVAGKLGELEQGKRPALEQDMDRHFGFRRISPRNKSVVSGQAKLPPDFDPTAKPTAEMALRIGALNGFPKNRGRWAFSNQVIAYSACTDPLDFPQLGKHFRTYDGKVAPGIDLDGKTKRGDFSGLDGAKGVDNQLWRVMGCVRTFRENGDKEVVEKIFISARAPTLIEIRGIDDPRNDPEVTVNIYAASGSLVRNARGGALAGMTFDIDKDPALRATTRGRIVDGVLTTDPVDIRLNYKEQIIDAPRQILGARIRATLKPDGGIDGAFFGYYSLASYWDSIEQMTQNGANLTSVSCPGVYRALHRFADGYRDPRTGRYTAISSAYGFTGVRAFVANAPAEFASRRGQ